MKKVVWWIFAFVGAMLVANADTREWMARARTEAIAWLLNPATSPAGNLAHAERALQRELPRFSEAQSHLSEERRKLRESLEEARQLREYACQLIDEFRSAYRQADRCEAFPIVVRERAYTQDQAHAQVELLVTQLEERDQAIAKVAAVLAAAEQQTIELASVESRAKQEIAILPLRRSLAKAEEVHARSAELIAEVAHSSPSAPSKDPVRTLEELLKAEADVTARARLTVRKLLD